MVVEWKSIFSIIKAGYPFPGGTVVKNPLPMQETWMRYHLTPARRSASKNLHTRNAGKDVEKREPSYTVGGNVNWRIHYGKRCRGSAKSYKQSCHVMQ